MEYITGKDLYQMFNYGSNKILKEREKLNEINVFPVPDSDTGNNLASTLNAIKQTSVTDDNFQNSLDAISESALYGARGNSGVIFAQFCNGLRYASKGKARVTIYEFALMVKESVEYIYKSISNPVEGTMITVIKDWANSLLEIVKKNVNSIKKVFETAFAKAKLSLEKTKERLKVLKKHNVVDSGAMGFVLFLQGINSYYNKEIIEEVNYKMIESVKTDVHTEDTTYRYCTEGLVQATTSLDQSELRNKLNPLGDSLIIAKGLNIFRVHIHTDNPELVFKELNQYGEIITQKVDNMIQDIMLTQSDSKRVIVTDSIADIPKDILHEENIVQIPINLMLNGVEYFDKISMNNEILFDTIPVAKEYPTTAMPALKYVEDKLKKLLQDYQEILIVSVSSNLSGTFNILKQAATNLQTPGKRIEVFDTLTNSVTEGLLVKKANELIKTDMSFDDILLELEALKEKTNILVCLKTIKYATMSGRVPKVVGKIGDFIGMRPIMSLDKEGKGTAFGIAFSKKGITKKIKKIINKEKLDQGIDTYGIVHCLNPELAKEYKRTFTEILGFEPEYITEVSSATAIHSGIGTVAIGYIRK